MIKEIVDNILSIDNIEETFLGLDDEATKEYYALVIASLGYFNYLIISNVFAALLQNIIANAKYTNENDLNEIFDYLMDLSLSEI
jgi:hypothetical protein